MRRCSVMLKHGVFLNTVPMLYLVAFFHRLQKCIYCIYTTNTDKEMKREEENKKRNLKKKKRKRERSSQRKYVLREAYIEYPKLKLVFFFH